MHEPDMGGTAASFHIDSSKCAQLILSHIALAIQGCGWYEQPKTVADGLKG